MIVIIYLISAALYIKLVKLSCGLYNANAIDLKNTKTI